jgi:hypothetical protein
MAAHQLLAARAEEAVTLTWVEEELREIVPRVAPVGISLQPDSAVITPELFRVIPIR